MHPIADAEGEGASQKTDVSYGLDEWDETKWEAASERRITKNGKRAREPLQGPLGKPTSTANQLDLPQSFLLQSLYPKPLFGLSSVWYGVPLV